MKHIRRKITLAVLGSVLLVFAVLLSAVNLFIPNYLTSEAKKAILLVEQDDSIIPLNGGEGMSETEDEYFLLTSVKYLEVEGALYETEHLSLAERKLLNHCRKTELAEGEFYTYKTGSSRFVFRLTAVEGYEDEEAYSYILYVDVGAVMKYASLLNLLFFGLFVLLCIGVYLFGMKLGGYVERAYNSQKWFFQNVSHELKTPLMAIQGCAEGIQTGVLEPDGASAAILEESEQMSNLLTELLTLSKLESGQIKSEFHHVDVRELLYDCMRSAEPIAAAKSLALTPRFADTSVTVNGDEIQLHRAFSNLLSNALRYAKSEIVISCQTEKNKAVITVRDDGGGIDFALLPHIFDRFYSGRKDGTGIGLALVKEIVALHKGTVTAKNDGGAVFEIRL